MAARRNIFIRLAGVESRYALVSATNVMLTIHGGVWARGEFQVCETYRYPLDESVFDGHGWNIERLRNMVETAGYATETLEVPGVIDLSLSFAFKNKENLSGGQSAFSKSFKPYTLAPGKFIKHIESGLAWTPGCFKNATRRKENFLLSQILALDLDDSKKSVEELAEDAFIEQYAYYIYPTPSSTERVPKSRVVFILDEPVKDVAAWEQLQAALMRRLSYLKPDEACKDAARLYYGSTVPGAALIGRVLPIRTVEALTKPQNDAGGGGFSHVPAPTITDQLPDEFIRDIESTLRVHFRRSEWSEPIRCPFKAHEHDDTRPAASWNRDKHFLHCLKCGESWNAKEVGAVIGLTLAARPEDVPLDAMGTSYKPTDDELGDQLIQELGDNFRFLYGEWYKYERGVWTPEPREIPLMLWDVMIKNKAKGIRPTQSKANSIEAYLRLRLMVTEEEVDSAPQYINLRNGLFNLETGKLEQHRREMYLTSQLPFEYNQDAVSNTWLHFLEDVLVDSSGKTDKTLWYVVQEAFGYSLTADTGMRVSFWLVGESGSGKSVMLDALINLAGNSHAAIDLDELSRTSYQLADIAGKRVVTFTEPDSRSVLADSHYKRLVSQDQIMARQIHGKPFRFTPMCKLWGAMNDTPRIVDRSDAVFNRVIIIPFNRSIPQELRDPQLSAKLRQELPGIFNWAIRGLARLRQQKRFTACAQIDSARSEFKEENDIELAFVDQWCVRGGGDSIAAQELYDAYSLWCRRNGAVPKSSVKVARDWKRLGFKKRKSNLIYYDGLKLTQLAEKFIRTV